MCGKHIVEKWLRRRTCIKLNRERPAVSVAREAVSMPCRLCLCVIVRVCV